MPGLPLLYPVYPDFAWWFFSPMNDAAPSLEPASPARAPTIQVRVRDLTKRFGAFTALNGVSLDVAKGEFVCFLGPSGCGKTTLLRAIAGLDPQNAGSIEIGGRDVSHLPPAARDFGIVFQSYALFPNLTVADNVGYGLVNRRQSRAETTKRVAELLQLVGMPEQSTKYPIQLSGGQQQRVALARALATSPSLLLLDEPLSALDARVRVHLRDEIKSLQRRLGVTTIMVTHDQEEALSMADRIVVMSQGHIEQIGTPEDIYSRPGTEFVANFVGEMNLLDATAQSATSVLAGSAVLATGGGDEVTAGQKLRLGFRPEDVRVGDLAANEPNTIEATVEAVQYLGSFWRATLRVPALNLAVVTADIPVAGFRQRPLQVGQATVVAIPPSALRVFLPRGSA